MDDLRLRLVAETSLGLVLGAALLVGPAFGQAPDISGTYWATEYHPKLQIVGGGELPLTRRGQGGLREEHRRPEERHHHRRGAQVLRARRAAAGARDALSVRHHPGAAGAGDDGPRAQSPDPGGRARQADAERGRAHPVPVLQRPFGRPFRGRHAGRRVRPASTKRPFSTRPARRTPTRCGRPSASARSARRELEDVITIHDPQYYTKDFQARFVYKLRNDVRLEDYVCGEPHRDISGVAGVRRP